MIKLENSATFFLINGLPIQRGSVAVTTDGEDYVGLSIIGTSKHLVDSVHFSEWEDLTSTPYATKQLLLDDISAFCFRSNAAGISDAPSDNNPYYRENGVWKNDRVRTLRLGVLGGQNVNTIGGLELQLDNVQLSLPNLLSDDFSYGIGDSFVTVERDGFIKVDFKIVSENQINSRKNPTMVLTKNVIDILETISYTYSRDTTNDLAQNTLSSFIVPVTVGDVLSVFSIRTGSAGSVLTVTNESYISFKYVNNARQ